MLYKLRNLFDADEESADLSGDVDFEALLAAAIETQGEKSDAS